MNFSSKNTWIVILLFSLFEFIIKKIILEISTLTKFPKDALIGFVPLFPDLWIFVRM